MEKSRRDVEPFSSFGKPLSKGERIRDLGSVKDSHRKGKEFCPNKEIFTTSLKRKLIMQLRQSQLRRSMNWTEEHEKMQNAEFLFLKLACTSNPRGWNSIRLIN